MKLLSNGYYLLLVHFRYSRCIMCRFPRTPGELNWSSCFKTGRTNCYNGCINMVISYLGTLYVSYIEKIIEIVGNTQRKQIYYVLFVILFMAKALPMVILRSGCRSITCNHV